MELVPASAEAYKLEKLMIEGRSFSLMASSCSEGASWRLALVQIKGALEPKLRRVTALMLAAASGSQETVRLLMESGASVDAVRACVCFVGGFR